MAVGEDVHAIGDAGALQAEQSADRADVRVPTRGMRSAWRSLIGARVSRAFLDPTGQRCSVQVRWRVWAYLSCLPRGVVLKTRPAAPGGVFGHEVRKNFVRPAEQAIFRN